MSLQNPKIALVIVLISLPLVWWACDEPVPPSGCTDITASNYDDWAVEDDYSCEYHEGGTLIFQDEFNGSTLDDSKWVHDIGNGECDYYGVQNDTIINILSCPEFNYDGGTPPNFTDGDCNQVDCRGVHFSDDLCAVIFDPDSTISIDSLTYFPDTKIVTTKITKQITGCYLGEYSDSIRTEMIYKFGSGRQDSIPIATDSIIVVGTTGWLRDGECDSDGFLFDDYGLDFNCVEFDFEGGDCYSLGRLDTHIRKKSISKKLYQVGNKKHHLEYPN